MMFLNPEKPIATCISTSCDNCPVKKIIHCHFKPQDLFHFLFLSLPPFLLGGAGIYKVSGWLLIPWLLFAIAFFGLIEIRALCSHCPHYAEPGKSLKCWANYGSTKLWKYRPGPMTITEKLIFFGGLTIVGIYPLLILIISHQVFLIIIYLITIGGFFMTLKTYLCSQCMNFACPLNSVAEKDRDLFFDRNPTIAKAWGNHIE